MTDCTGPIPLEFPLRGHPTGEMQLAIASPGAAYARIAAAIFASDRLAQ